MHSRLLTKLASEAQTTNDPESWARSMCRAASHFGRQGHNELALEAIGRVRSRFGTNLSPSVGAWLMLAEGITHFFQDQPDPGFDRVRRAYGISVAANLGLVRPACAAWMAHLEFNSLRFEEMAKHLEEALSLADKEDHQAQARASLVLADALHFTGDFAAARPWYEKTRLHATAEGDEATLSAMLHNVAAFRLGNIKISDVAGDASPAESKRAMMEANSALNFDIRLGTASFTTLVPILQGQLLTIQKRYAEAEDLLRKIELKRLEKKSVPLLLVDLGWCCAAQGRTSEASELGSQASALLSPATDIDDIMYINARLAQIAENCGDQERAMQFRSTSLDALAKHQAQQRLLRTRLDALSNWPR